MHLADVSHHGPYVDFGTPARLHYTMGRWHNGFLSDVSAGDRDFTRTGTEARAFVHVDEAAALTLRLRGRAVASRSVAVYVNGRRAGQVDFGGDGVEEHDVAVAPELVVRGENEIMLRASQTRAVEGEQVAFELDSLWLLPSPVPNGELTPPRYAELVRELSAGGESRRGVVVRGPTSVRWYAEIPEDAKLSFAVASAGASPGTARVTITPEGGEPVELFRAPLAPRWSEQLLDLSRFAGEVVRIEMSVDAGEAGFAQPAVVVPLPPPLAPARARSAIVVLVDTLRATKLRVYEPRSRVQTPALDAFAAEAAVFERAQSPENWTKPAVASILTSLTPTTHNTKTDRAALPESALMVSEVFQREGFATASFIANGYVSDRFGFRQGWDHYTNYIREQRNTEAEKVFDEAIAWIEAHRDERFFAYVHTIDPHVPYDPPQDILRLYDPEPYDGPISPRRTGLQLGDVKLGRLTLTPRDIRRLEALHDGEITYHDRHFARFVARLRELGLYDEVVFVVTADHGEEFNEHGSFGHGHSVYQELLHVPLMVRWHGVIEPRRIAATVSTLDVSPTILEATGVPIPDVFEGQSLLSTARGVPRPGPAVAFSDKLDDRRVATAAGYKLIVRGNLTWSFFDLRRDPGERTQIDDPGRYPIALRYLRGLMGQHLGAADRGAWLEGGTGPSRALPSADSHIDRQLCEQLRSIGYHDSRCDALL
ncbi:MAG TPA: sulfatase [Sandaracinaceae bacterium]